MNHHRVFSFIVIFLLLIGSAHAVEVPLNQRLAQTNRAIAAANAQWRAGDSFITQMPMDDFVVMLGVDPQAPKRQAAPWMPETSIKDVPALFDWRDVEGRNFVTPVKYQGRCGSCVAFGCVAAIESGIMVRDDNSYLNIDLSEQHAFNCCYFSGCDFGSNASFLLGSIMGVGVVDESCFPYMSGGTGYDYECGDACSDWNSRAFKIEDYNSIWGGVDMIKQAMLQHGPITATFSVYEDFKYYIDGVYEHVFGPLLGGHQVLLVGWQDENQCWIVKNSWSESFGEDGYFRIKWNSSGISLDCTIVDVGDDPYLPGELPGGNCVELANHLYGTCGYGYEMDGQTLSAEAFLNQCNVGNIPQCVHSCHEQHASCNELAGCVGFCADQWCSMVFDYLYDTCELAVELEPGNPMPKAEAVALCNEVGYNSNAMKCILECVPQTDNCTQLDACMGECDLCLFPTVDFTADVVTAETAPLTVTFTTSVTIPDDCGPNVWHWDFGDGASTYDNSEVVQHTYQAEGTYSVELRVTNASGPGIKFAEELIYIGSPPVDDDTVDDDVVDDDIVDDDIVDDDIVDDDIVDDDAVDDDATDGDDDDDATDDDDNDVSPGDDDDDNDSDSGGCCG